MCSRPRLRLGVRVGAPSRKRRRKRHGAALLRTRFMAEIYVSTDVEADGPIPGPHSMLSFASAAYLGDKTPVGTYQANLALLPEARGEPRTMAWWESQPEAWAACRRDVREPAVVMPEYVAWLKALPGKPVFV